MSTIGELIQEARKKQQLKQDQLAEQVRTIKQRISAIERGRSLPTLEQLVGMHDALATAHDQERGTSLVIWLLEWLNDKVQKSTLGSDKKEAIQTAIEEVRAQIRQPTLAWKPGTRRSLEGFPGAFEPLTIVCGDRRELPPMTRGDLFAYSGSIIDLTFLQQLDLRAPSTMIKADKLFVVMDDEDLRLRCGKTNLLVIGSPGTNLLARMINNDSVFRFNLDDALKGWAETLHSAQQLNDQQALEVFWEMVQHRNDLPSLHHRHAWNLSPETVKELADLVEQLTGNQSLDDLVNRFRQPVLIDPAYGKVRLTTTRPNKNNDFAIISLAKHPFADNTGTTDYVCIMVAGLAGLGTAHALRALAEADFRERPFGGIIEVEQDPFKDWLTRFERARWKWLTDSYTPQQILTNLENELKQNNAAQGRALLNLTPEEIEACIKFVRSLG